MSPGTPHATDVTSRLAEVLPIHFDPRWGAPYWLARARELSIDWRDPALSIHDLPRFGPIEAATLGKIPLDDFIPRRFAADRDRWILGQTGGTTGSPAWTVYSPEEFEAAFVEPFDAAARHVGFPHGAAWLYVGPSGPHLIGRAAEAIARRIGGAPPFTVDFDPRWAHKLAAGSFAAERYLAHVVDQAMDIVDGRDIGVIFSTPPVLRRLAQRMAPTQRNRIRGIHYGGLPLHPDDLAYLQQEAFPQAVHLAGYGNTLFGCGLELNAKSRRTPDYYPFGLRLVFGTAGDSTNEQVDIVYNTPGQEGRVVFSRIDRMMFLPNVLERDRGMVVAPPADAPAGFFLCGVRSPHGIQPTQAGPAALY